MNLLFICSKNQWRSPTAEGVFRKDTSLNVRSKGTSRSARQTVSARDIEWADLVLVMEPKHKKRLFAEYPGEMAEAETHVLDIPDDYQYMDPELIQLLESSVWPLLEGKDELSIPKFVTVDGFTKPDLLAALGASEVQLNQAAQELFADERFQPSLQAGAIEIETRTVESLGFNNGATYDQLVARAAEFKLIECPLELAAYLRLQYLAQPVAPEKDASSEPGSPPGALTIASAPLDDRDQSPKGFYLRNIDGTLWLRGYWSDAPHIWSNDDVFIFAVADNPTLR